MKRKNEKIRRLFENEEEFNRWVNVRHKGVISLTTNVLFISLLFIQVYYYKHIAFTDSFLSGKNNFLVEYILIVMLSLFTVLDVDKLIDNQLHLKKLKKLENENTENEEQLKT